MGIIVNINLLSKNEKEYLKIQVPPYPIAISCKGIYYYRSGSTNQKLTGSELESFILRRRGATWDNIPLPSLTMNDIDDGIVSRFKQFAAKKGRIDKNVLKRLNKRLERGETWAKSQIDSCIKVFDTEITEEKIITDNRNIDYVVKEIAKRSGVTLLLDKRTFLKKGIDRVITLIKHIR